MTHQSSPLEINFYFTQPPCFVFSCRSNYLYEGGLSHCDPLKDGICLSYYKSPLGVRLNIYVYHSVPVANVQAEPGLKDCSFYSSPNPQSSRASQDVHVLVFSSLTGVIIWSIDMSSLSLNGPH